MWLLFTTLALLIFGLRGLRRYSELARQKRQTLLSWNRVDTLIGRRNALLAGDLAKQPADTQNIMPSLRVALERLESVRLRGSLEDIARAEAAVRTMASTQPLRGYPGARSTRRLDALNGAIDEGITIYNQTVEKYNRTRARHLQRLLPGALHAPGYEPLPPLPESPTRP
ncbi:MAG: hypothetical protein ACQETK_00840 [Pseudomonadota bacterium]